MEKVEDIVKALENLDDENRKAVKDVAEKLRQIADDIEIFVKEGVTEEELEKAIGSIILKYAKIVKIIGKVEE